MFNRAARRIVLALASALIAGSVLASPAAATTPDGAWANFGVSIDGDQALIFLSYTGTTTVNAGVTGLSASEYFVFGSAQGCGKKPSAANKVFRITGSTDENGVLWLRRSPSIPAIVRSIWLGPTAGPYGAPQCGRATNYTRIGPEVGGDFNGDGLLGIWDKEHVLSLLEREPNSKARLTVVTAFWGTETFTYSAVDTRCGHQPTHTFFHRRVIAAHEGASDSWTLSLTANQMGRIRSARAVGGVAHECAPMVIMANTEGD